MLMPLNASSLPNHIPILIRKQLSFAHVQQHERIAPGVCDHRAAPYLNIERRDKQAAPAFQEAPRPLVSRIDEPIHFLPRLLIL